MGKRSFVKTMFVLACVCVCLPWFTWNAKVTGYCRGLAFAPELAIPMITLGVFLWSGSDNKYFTAFAELCALLMLAVPVIAVGTWQSRRLISSGWDFALRPIQPGYWLTLIVFAVFFAALQFRIFKKPK